MQLGGPPLGGALFGLGRSLPFLFDAISYAFSTLSLLAMRTPFQEPRDPRPVAAPRADRRGLQVPLGQPFLRTCAFLYGIGNFVAPGTAAGDRRRRSRGRVSPAARSACSPRCSARRSSSARSRRRSFRRALSVRQILLLELWTWSVPLLFLVWPNVYVLAAALVPFGLAAPVTDSVVVGYRVALTPDRLLGRVESVRSSISLLVAPLGPLVAGLCSPSTSARVTVAFFTRASGWACALGNAQPVDPERDLERLVNAAVGFGLDAPTRKFGYTHTMSRIPR